MGADPHWPSADTWLLLSVHDSRKWRLWTRWVSLRAIVGTADAINHAIPTEEEFDGAARRLSAADLLAVDGDRLSLTPSGRKLMREARARFWHEEWGKLVKVLGEMPMPDAELGQGLASGAFEHAVTTYLRDHGMEA
jgi:hypothetical protein